MKGSVEFVTGALGSGKTLLVVSELLYNHVKAGGYAFHNIEVFHDEWAKKLLDDGLVFDPSRLVNLTGSAREFDTQIAQGTDDHQVMVVIDEVHLSHNSRDWADTDRAQLDLVTLVRKLNIRLVFITQDMTNVDKQFRKMAVYRWHCVNLAAIRLMGVIPLPLPLCLRIRHFMSNGNTIHTEREVIPLPRWAFKLYNTKALIGEAAARFSNLRKVEGGPLQRAQGALNSSAHRWLEVGIAAGVAFIITI